MIEETRKIKEEDAAYAIGGNTVPGFKAKESGGIRSREEFAGTKLSWAQKIVMEVEGAETGGDYFLE